MNRVKKTAVAAKEFAVRHKTAIAVTGTIIAMGAISRIALRDHQNFIDQQGLADEFMKYMTGE